MKWGDKQQMHWRESKVRLELIAIHEELRVLRELREGIYKDNFVRSSDGKMTKNFVIADEEGMHILVRELR